ncbi:MAG TPA: 4-(cytidine 5'-diphospho)-2-C-methyl-D-erythritol kinase [Bacteroidota bacterium]
MTTRAYAKINLGLRVLRKRTDGYHDIETVFHHIDLYDELSFRLHEHDILLTSSDASLPTDHNNLCFQAAQLLRDLTGMQEGVEIAIKKNIPLGAGLGGGSADAAATLKTLTALWNLELTERELHSLALSLGSDVPFFLQEGSAYGTGRGEELQVLTLRLPHWIVTVTPPIHVSTAAAYKNLARDDRPSPLSGLQSILLGHLHEVEALRKNLQNDFEPVVFELHPEIRTLKEEMLAEGADVALLSGSGSSVFALTKSDVVAKHLFNRLARYGRVSLTRPLFIPEHHENV